MPRVLQVLNEQAPGIEIDVSPLTATLNRQIESGKIDLAVIPADFNLMVRDGPISETLLKSTLFTDSWVCAVSDDHPQIRDELTLEDYLEFPHVVPNFGKGIITFEEVAIRRAALHIKTRAAIPSFTTLLSLVPGSTLIATIQKKLATKYIDRYPIALFDPPLNISELKEMLVWHERNDYDPGLTWLRKLITRIARDL
jgi:DNA-binding transcriptional LysR family regulator